MQINPTNSPHYLSASVETVFGASIPAAESLQTAEAAAANALSPRSARHQEQLSRLLEILAAYADGESLVTEEDKQAGNSAYTTMRVPRAALVVFKEVCEEMLESRIDGRGNQDVPSRCLDSPQGIPPWWAMLKGMVMVLDKKLRSARSSKTHGLNHSSKVSIVTDDVAQVRASPTKPREVLSEALETKATTEPISDSVRLMLHANQNGAVDEPIDLEEKRTA